MKKNKIILIILILLVLLAIGGGVFYWKIERIIKSVAESAKKASSQNTPLLDE